MRLSLRTQALILTAVPLLVLLVVFALAIVRAQEADRLAYWGQHSQTVLEADAGLSATVTELNLALAQNNQQRTPETRARFERAIAALRQQTAELQTLVADNPAQTKRAKHISAIIDQFIPLARQIFGLADQPAKQREVEQSKTVQLQAQELQRTRAEFERVERQLAISRFRTFSGQAKLFATRFIAMLSIGIVICAVLLLVLGRQLSRRFAQLRSNVELLANGEDPVPLDGSDELASLDRQFRETTLRMRQEQAISSQLQRALLPQQLPTIAGIRIDASYRPAATGTQIGGDWYDVFILGDHTIGISMGDVTGHGLLAASTMALVRQSIQTAARYTRDASAVLELVNRNIFDQAGAVVSAFVAIFDTNDGRMQYAVAGHPAPITVRSTGTVGMLAGSGLLLGVERNAQYERFETRLETGSALILYTDGLVETHRGNYSLGVTQLIEAISAEYYNSSENIAEAIQNRIFAQVMPHDDSAIVFIGVTELDAPGGTLTRTWDIDAKAISEARRLKRALLWHLGQYTRPDEDLTSVELILGELLGNVARHTPGRATVTLEVERDAAKLHVSDTGEAIGPVPVEFVDDLAESGRGLFLVNALARELRIERHPTGNHVVALLPVTLETARPLTEFPAFP